MGQRAGGAAHVASCGQPREGRRRPSVDWLVRSTVDPVACVLQVSMARVYNWDVASRRAGAA